MNENQTIELLEKIDLLYPGKLIVTTKMVKEWHRIFKDQDFGRVMWRLDKHAKNNQFAPTISDLYERYRPEHDRTILKKMDDWEKKASKGPSPEQRKQIMEILGIADREAK